jgi:hypothetical protein
MDDVVGKPMPRRLEALCAELLSSAAPLSARAAHAIRALWNDNRALTMCLLRTEMCITPIAGDVRRTMLESADIEKSAVLRAVSASEPPWCCLCNTRHVLADPCRPLTVDAQR